MAQGRKTGGDRLASGWQPGPPAEAGWWLTLCLNSGTRRRRADQGGCPTIIDALRHIAFMLLAVAVGAAQSAAQQNPVRPGVDGNLIVTVGKSMIIDSPVQVEKISIANGELAEAVAVNPKEVLINGKAPGQTSLIVWQRGGTRLVYDLTVRMSPVRLDAVRQQIARDFPDEDINVTFDNDTAFVRGTVKNMIEAERVMAIVTTLGKAVDLLRVQIPAEEPQILLKVRFADVDRSATTNLGLNIASTAFNQATGISTGQFGGQAIDSSGAFNLSDALNVLLLRRDINLGVTIQALASKNLLQMLAEPNVLAINGKVASFISGGEIPVPMVQSTAGPGAISVAYKEYGIKLSFLPVVTPRGTIRLQVQPEVSSLDYSNSVSISGTTVPGTTVRRIQTEVDLEDGQSFVIAGLLDRTTTETLSKIPGLANIPLFGKLFQSRALQRGNSELLIIVTPELVRPIPKGQKTPELRFPEPWLDPGARPPRHPGVDTTGPVPTHPPVTSLPVEQLIQQQRQYQQQPQGPSNTPAMPAPAPQPPTIGGGLGGAASTGTGGPAGGVQK